MAGPQLPPDVDPHPAAWKERVLACFEALRLQRAPLAIETLDGVQMEGHIESMDAVKGRLVLGVSRAPSRGLDADDEVRLFFTMQGNRWEGRARVHYHNDRRDRFTLALLSGLESGDRRRELRVLLDPSENVKATLVPAGPVPIEVVGRLSNLSEGGCRLRVEGVRDVREDRLLDPSEAPLEENQSLESVRITGLGGRSLEAKGVVLDVDPQPLGPVVGLRFRPLFREDLDFLRAYIQARAQVPPPEAPLLPSPPKSPSAAVLEPSPPEPGPEADHGPRADLRLKRFRSLTLVMPPGPEREGLQAFLAFRGFTRVSPAGTLAELAGAVRKTAPDAFLVDWPDAPASGLDIVQFLGRHPFQTAPRIILACGQPTPQLAQEANRLGVSHLLVKPYSLDEALVGAVLQALGGE